MARELDPNINDYGVLQVDGDELLIDVVNSYTDNYTVNITQNPVDEGLPVAEAISENPISLSVTARFISKIDGDTEDIKNYLLDHMKNGNLFTVQIGNSTYDSMALRSVTTNVSSTTGFSLPLSMQFIEVRRVEIEIFSVNLNLSIRSNRKPQPKTTNVNVTQSPESKKKDADPTKNAKDFVAKTKELLDGPDSGLLQIDNALRGDGENGGENG